MNRLSMKDSKNLDEIVLFNVISDQNTTFWSEVTLIFGRLMLLLYLYKNI